MKWPHNKDFAFTIIDDTDNSTLEYIKPIYEFLCHRQIKTTLAIWVFPSRDKYTGLTIQEKDYLEFLFDLERKGFEIQLHNVGSGSFNRNEILHGFSIFNETFNRYPNLHVNHSMNPNNIYWGYKRYGPALGFLVRLFMGNRRRFYGDEVDSGYFWGDLSKKYVKYIRNLVFNGINTLRYDPRMPYVVKNKEKYSNYWFSSSDGHTVEEFNRLVSKKNVEILRDTNGLCIVYTHFASGFLDNTGAINNTFKQLIEYLSSQNGWFAPATQILDFLLENQNKKPADFIYIGLLDLRWFLHRVAKKVRFGR